MAATSNGGGTGVGTATLTITIGGILVYSALKGIGIPDVLKGVTGDPLDPHGARVNLDKGDNPSAGTLDTQAELGGIQAETKGGWVYPLSSRGNVIGTPYVGTHTLGNWQSDNAYDIATSTGTPVLAVRDGRVSKIGGSWSGGASRFDGLQVTLTTDAGGVFYTHLSKRYVKLGSRVRAGQVIGLSGAANGVQHLHIGFQNKPPAIITGS